MFEVNIFGWHPATSIGSPFHPWLAVCFSSCATFLRSPLATARKLRSKMARVVWPEILGWLEGWKIDRKLCFWKVNVRGSCIVQSSSIQSILSAMSVVYRILYNKIHTGTSVCAPPIFNGPTSTCPVGFTFLRRDPGHFGPPETPCRGPGTVAQGPAVQAVGTVGCRP